MTLDFSNVPYIAMRHMSALRNLSIANKAAVLFDRGYYSGEFCIFMANSSSYFVFRMKTDSSQRKRERTQAERAEKIAQAHDIERAREICRKTRDDASASDADRLEAVRLLYIIND